MLASSLMAMYVMEYSLFDYLSVLNIMYMCDILICTNLVAMHIYVHNDVRITMDVWVKS